MSKQFRTFDFTKAEPSKEEEIFKALISRETTFKIDCIEFKEDLIVGTVKERERKCRARAKVLVKLVEGC